MKFISFNKIKALIVIIYIYIIQNDITTMYFCVKFNLYTEIRQTFNFSIRFSANKNDISVLYQKLEDFLYKF